MARMNETLAASLELLRSRFRESEEKSQRDLEHLEARAKALKQSILSGNFPPVNGASLPSIVPPSGRDVGESSNSSRPQRVLRSTTKLQVNPEESAHCVDRKTPAVVDPLTSKTTSKPVDSKDNLMKSYGISGTSLEPEALTGAKSTLVGDKVPLSKQSIGANSTYVVDDSKRISHNSSLWSISEENAARAPKFSGMKTYLPKSKYRTQNPSKAASNKNFQTNTTGASEMSGSKTGDTAHLKKLARKSVDRAIQVANGAKLNKKKFLPVAKSALKQFDNDLGVNALSGSVAVKEDLTFICRKGNFKPSKPDFIAGKMLQNERDDSYDATLSPKFRQPLPSKSQDDYGLDDACTDDSSDDESNPKKTVPKWAKGVPLEVEWKSQSQVSLLAACTFFGRKESTPDLRKIFNF